MAERRRRRRFKPAVSPLESRLPLDGSSEGPGDAGTGATWEPPGDWSGDGSGAFCGPPIDCTPDPTDPGNLTQPCLYRSPITGDPLLIEPYGCGDAP